MSDEHPGVTADQPLPPAERPRITPREKEILDLIAEGLTDQQIARRRLGDTQGQEVEPRRSPEDLGGEAAADEQRETEMLNRTSSLCHLAALLAMSAQNGAALARPYLAPTSIYAAPPSAKRTGQGTSSG
jgi:hypothetical protein